MRWGSNRELPTAGHFWWLPVRISRDQVQVDPQHVAAVVSGTRVSGLERCPGPTADKPEQIFLPGNAWWWYSSGWRGRGRWGRSWQRGGRFVRSSDRRTIATTPRSDTFRTNRPRTNSIKNFRGRTERNFHIEQRYHVVLMGTCWVGLKWGLGWHGVWFDGQAGPCMGQCMAWCMGGGGVIFDGLSIGVCFWMRYVVTSIMTNKIQWKWKSKNWTTEIQKHPNSGILIVQHKKCTILYCF